MSIHPRLKKQLFYRDAKCSMAQPPFETCLTGDIDLLLDGSLALICRI